jgi:hypothetical protein
MYRTGSAIWTGKFFYYLGACNASTEYQSTNFPGGRSFAKTDMMKLTLIISIINLAISCSSPDKSSNTENSSKSKAISVISSKDTVPESSKLSGKTITITVSYAAIECGCPQWFETKFKNVKFLEGVERFY